MSLARAYLSGSVRRFHASPALAATGQTNADHQGRSGLLAFLLHPSPGVALLRCLLTHDLGELEVGDLPALFKARRPDLAAAHAVAEAEARLALCGPDDDLSADDLDWLRLIDRLEAHCWCLATAPQEYDRPDARWRAGEPALLGLADRLGCGDAVRGLLHDLKGGRW